MTPKQVLKRLESLADERVRERNARLGASKQQIGVPLGELRKVAKELKSDHALGLELWATGIEDARLLATLLVKPKELSAAELTKMVKAAKFSQLADWLNAYVVKKHPDHEALREKWLQQKDAWTGRSAWSLTTARVEKGAEGIDVAALLDRIEAEMADAPEATRWTMNFCLVAIGTHHAKLRKRAITVGEAIGAYRDYPVSKGCVSPFAPIAIPEMAKRLG